MGSDLTHANLWNSSAIENKLWVLTRGEYVKTRNFAIFPWSTVVPVDSPNFDFAPIIALA